MLLTPPELQAARRAADLAETTPAAIGRDAILAAIRDTE